MNALSKLIAPISNAVNGIFDNMGSRTVDMIRQTYLFLIFALCIVGLIIGASIGKKSAKKTGMQIVETTNRVFDADIMQSREEGGFGTILEGSMQSEKINTEGSPMRMPARESIEMENNIHIVEADRDRHIRTDPEAMERHDLPDPARLDERNPVADNNVKPLKRSVKTSKSEVVDKAAFPPISAAKKKDEDIRSERPASPAKDGRAKKLKPLDKDTVISE